MKILQITPGTGTFYCGSCMRDNALARQLRRQGHEATTAPMYLPPVLDEPPAEAPAPLFFGGINVYLQQKLALFRHTPRWLDQLWDAPALLRWAARQAHLTSAADQGDLLLSMLRGQEGHQAKELSRLVHWLKTDSRPQVVCLSNAMLLGLAPRIKRDLGVPVVCTLQGEDSFLDALPQTHRDTAWALLTQRARDVDAFIAVSEYYAQLMRRRLNLPADRVHVVHNGITLQGHEVAASPPSPPSPPAIGYLARFCRAKGLPTLVEAYILLRRRGRVPNVRLRLAGAQTADDARLVHELTQRLAAEGLSGGSGGSGGVDWHPNIDRPGKLAFLRSLSVLSVPATYGESFGLYMLEALASGVPVVEPRHGALPELIQATGGGLLCEPDNAQDLALKLETLLLDPALAQRLGAQGRAAVHQRFGVDRMAQEVLKMLEQVVRQPLSLEGEGGSVLTAG